jgi:hypothetical protein
MRRVILIAVLALSGLSITAQGRTWYVKPDGSGDVPDISTGISLAVKGDTLLLADGVYTGTGNTNLGYQGKSIVIRSQSGDPHACVIDCGGTSSNHVRGFTFNQRERSEAVLEGVTIKNGYANEGGGVYCWAASPTISNVILSGNTAVYVGGALYCGRGATPVFRSITIDGNSADQGAGLYCTYYAAPVIRKTIISYSTNGGAVVLGGAGSNPTFSCCDIYGNTGGDWVGEISTQFGQSGNISEDPLYCMDALPETPYCLNSTSPCIPPPGSGCGIMGAGGVGCTNGIEATIDIDPNVLNPRSPRRWLTCYVELSGGHDPLDIDVSTVVLNGAVNAATHPTAVGDHDADGIADRMVKFSWRDALASLAGGGDVEVEVSGSAGGEVFSGVDTVRVLDKSTKKGKIARGDPDGFTGEITVVNPGDGGHGFGIQLDLTDHAHVRIAVYDVRGREVGTLVDGVKTPAVYSVFWDAKDRSGARVAPGIYFVDLNVDDYRTTTKVLVAP